MKIDIGHCFKQETDGRNNCYWDNLIAAEGVRDFNDVCVPEQDACDAVTL